MDKNHKQTHKDFSGVWWRRHCHDTQNPNSGEVASLHTAQETLCRACTLSPQSLLR